VDQARRVPLREAKAACLPGQFLMSQETHYHAHETSSEGPEGTESPSAPLSRAPSR